MTRHLIAALLATSALAGGAVRAQEPAQAPAETAEPAPESFAIELMAGGGVGTRAFQRPLDRGLERLEGSTFPAVEAGARARLLLQQRFGLEALLRYQTSIGLSIEQRPLFAPENEVAVRAERVELSIAPRYSFGEPGKSPSVLLPIGASVRALWPDEHERGIAGYSLLGALLRAELELPIFESLAVRGAAEAQWILGIDEPVREQGLASTGLALGFEAMARLELDTRFALELAYRQSRARVAGKSGVAPLYDFERFVTLRLAGTL